GQFHLETAQERGFRMCDPRRSVNVRELHNRAVPHPRWSLKAFPELAILDTCLISEYAASISQRGGVCGRSGSQLHMTHELARALQQASRMGRRCAVK